MKKILLITALLLLQFPIVIAQYNTENNSLPHEMTPEELLRRHEIGINFTATDPPLAPVRNVAEFEHMQSVLIRYPFGIPMSVIVEMAQDCKLMTIVANASQQQQVLNQYISAGVNTANCEWLLAPTDSYWTRDYGPWFVVNGENEVGICDFIYNRPRPNDDNIPVVLAQLLGIELYGMDLETAGGNWMSDGVVSGASTDLIWEENSNYSHDSINAILESYLGIEKNHVLPDPLGDYIKHIDCWGKFLDVDKVLIGQVPQSDPRYSDYEYVASYFAIRASAYGNPYQVYRVYSPGTSPGTPYTNSLILNKKAFVPITGSQWDDEALATYADAMPGYEVVGVEYDGWENTDALHCRAIGIADVGMLYIRHFPLLGDQDFQQQWNLTADIIPYSGYGLKSNALDVYYKVDEGNYQSIPLTLGGGDTYSSTIPFQLPGSEVSYYLHAEDFSGRVMEHPYIGTPDPHVFTVDYATEAIVEPDTLVFTTFEEMLEGKSFNIYNFTENELVIDDIETQGEMFMWYTDPMPPAMPYNMGLNDTLTVNVKVTIPVDALAGYWVTDTLDIETELGDHKVILKIDSDLLSDIKDLYPDNASNICSVYPNPVKDETTLRINLEKEEDVLVELYDLSGKKLSTLLQQTLNAGSHENVWNAKKTVSPGVYFIKTTAGESISTVKVVVI